MLSLLKYFMTNYVSRFVDESLDIQVNSLLKLGDIDESTLVKAVCSF